MGAFGAGVGITYGQLAMSPVRGQVTIGVTFAIGARTIAGTNNYDLFDANGAPFPIRIIQAWGHMLAAADAGDTLLLNRISLGTTVAISDTIDLNAAGLADQDSFDFAQLNDASWLIGTGDNLRLVAAGNTLTETYLLCMRSSVATT